MTGVQSLNTVSYPTPMLPSLDLSLYQHCTPLDWARVTQQAFSPLPSASSLMRWTGEIDHYVPPEAKPLSFYEPPRIKARPILAKKNVTPKAVVAPTPSAPIPEPQPLLVPDSIMLIREISADKQYFARSYVYEGLSAEQITAFTTLLKKELATSPYQYLFVTANRRQEFVEALTRAFPEQVAAITQRLANDHCVPSTVDLLIEICRSLGDKTLVIVIPDFVSSENGDVVLDSLRSASNEVESPSLMQVRFVLTTQTRRIKYSNNPNSTPFNCARYLTRAYPYITANICEPTPS